MPEEEKPKFGKYQVMELLGEGGMGRVWRGFDPDLEVPVAIKELKEQFRDANNLERFYREAQIAAKCRHQNIVLITDLSKEPPYFAMEFLEAQELSLYVHKNKPLTLERMVKILGQVCDGLGFLHKRGIFHRDLKPANIMLLEDDTVKIADFGISKAPFGQKTMTQVIMGTIPYMAPEQITTPGSIDARVDLWALGIILFELTQRKHPFPGEGDINTIFHIVHSAPAPYGDLPPQVDGPLKEIITKALQKNPEDRIGSTKEFKSLLRGLLKGGGDPDEIVFPFQPPTDSTMILSVKDIPSVVNPELVDKARSLIAEIQDLPEAMRAVVEKGTYEKAAERAELSKKVLEEGDPTGIESAIRSLESQRIAINDAIQSGFDQLIARAETALGKGREAEAAALYRQVSGGDPSRAEAVDGFERAMQSLLTRGRRNQSQGNLTAAVEAWKEILRWEPAHGEATRLIDEVEGEKALHQEIQSAVETAGKALEAGKPEEAQAALREVFDHEPDHEEALRLKARAQEMIEEATRSLHVDALRIEGRQFLERREFDRAKISFATLLELLPGDEECARALETIDGAEAEKQKAGEARRVAAEAEKALHDADFKKAIGLYERALTHLPGDTEVSRRLQTAQRRMDALLNAESEAGQREKAGDLPAALQVWEQVLKLQPGHPDAGGEMERIRGLMAAQEEARRKEKAAQEESRKKEEAARHQAVERAWSEASGPLKSFGAIPKQDHRLLGGDLVGRASAAVEQMEKARTRGDEAALRDGAKALGRSLEKIEARRVELLKKKGAEVESAAAALEELLKPLASQLKEAAVRGGREALARARKEAAGPALHPLDGHVAALKKIRESIQREIQGALKAARERIGSEKALLAAAATKNRRAVSKRPELRTRIEGLLKQAATATGSSSLDSLGKLADGLEQARKQVPTDPLRFLPHMIAVAGAVLAAGVFLTWQYMQANTTHPFHVQVSPWGSVVSVQSDGGESIAPPQGESPVHRMELLPGTWTITAENSLTGATGTATVTVPDQAGATITLEGPDYREGIRDLLESDPWFEDGN